MFDELNLPISTAEIKLGVNQLRKGKSAGPDLFLNEFLKNGTNMLITYIYTLFNKILKLVIFQKHGSRVTLYLYLKRGIELRYQIIAVLHY